MYVVKWVYLIVYPDGRVSVEKDIPVNPDYPGGTKILHIPCSFLDEMEYGVRRSVIKQECP